MTGTGDDASVEEIAIDDDGNATFTVTQESVAVLTAMTPKTTQPARFTFTASR